MSVAVFKKLQLLALSLLALSGGCATTTVTPKPLPQASLPEYIQVPHPLGYDLSDVRAIFIDKRALGDELVANCDSNFKKLASLTQSPEERLAGARELVKIDPVLYHWCFYGKILGLENGLKADNYVDERQKRVLETYEFLVPVARAFMLEYKDSRYLRWSIRHYRRVSEWVFYRKLDLSPKATQELTEVTNPFGAWRQPAASKPVLEKYGVYQETPPDKLPAQGDLPEVEAAPLGTANTSALPVPLDLPPGLAGANAAAAPDTPPKSDPVESLPDEPPLTASSDEDIPVLEEPASARAPAASSPKKKEKKEETPVEEPNNSPFPEPIIALPAETGTK